MISICELENTRLKDKVFVFQWKNVKDENLLGKQGFQMKKPFRYKIPLLGRPGSLFQSLSSQSLMFIDYSGLTGLNSCFCQI